METYMRYNIRFKIDTKEMLIDEKYSNLNLKVNGKFCQKEKNNI